MAEAKKEKAGARDSLEPLEEVRRTYFDALANLRQDVGDRQMKARQEMCRAVVDAWGTPDAHQRLEKAQRELFEALNSIEDEASKGWDSAFEQFKSQFATAFGKLDTAAVDERALVTIGQKTAEIAIMNRSLRGAITRC